MDLPTSLLTCLCGLPNAHPHPAPTTTQHKQYRLITEKPRFEPAPSTTTPNHDSNNREGKTKNRDHSHDDERATKILTLIRTAPSPTTLTKQISDNVGPATSWSEYLAERVLRGLEETLRWAQDHQADWGEALTEAYTRATELAQEELRELWDYAKAHPVEVAAEVLLTVLALGVMARLVPGLLRLLGFAREGPVAGSFAAWWQSLYGGYVRKGSLWSFLQRLGMTWE